MNNEPNEIHFDCPKCKRPMTGGKELLGEMIKCPDCSEPFIPTPRKLDPKTVIHPTSEMASAAAALNAAQLAKLESQRVDAIASHAEKVHSQAERFTNAALLFCVMGLFIALGMVCGAFSGDPGFNGFIVAASLIGASLWLYLIAQVIHIRANTEK